MSKNNPLIIAAHGIDNRTLTTITLFLKGPCSGAGRIAADHEAVDFDMFDGDHPASKSLLNQHLERKIVRPIIILSINPIVQQENVLHLKKPVSTDNMLKILDQAKKCKTKLAKTEKAKQIPSVQLISEKPAQLTVEPEVPIQEKTNNVHSEINPIHKLSTNADTLDLLDDWFSSSL